MLKLIRDLPGPKTYELSAKYIMLNDSRLYVCFIVLLYVDIIMLCTQLVPLADKSGSS